MSNVPKGVCAINKPKLDWEECMSGDLLLLMNAVSEADGTVCLMFGGYGYYYKVSWKIGGRHEFISAETPGRLSELAAEAVIRGRCAA